MFYVEVIPEVVLCELQNYTIFHNFGNVCLRLNEFGSDAFLLDLALTSLAKQIEGILLVFLTKQIEGILLVFLTLRY